MNAIELNDVIHKIGREYNIAGLEIVDTLKGSRHQVVKLQDDSGKLYALRMMMEKELDVSYFRQSFSLNRECVVLEQLQDCGVDVPLIIANKCQHTAGEYALMSWLEGEHLSIYFNQLCKSRDVAGLYAVMTELAQLFFNIHSVSYPQFGVIGDASSQHDSVTDFFVRCIHECGSDDTFKSCYTGSIEALIDKAESLAGEVNSEVLPSLVVYDLHGENMMIGGGDGFALFDVDYAHAGVSTAEFIPIFHDLIGRFLSVGDELRLLLRSHLIEKYRALGGVFHDDLEPLIVLNHFIVSMIKLNYRTDVTAQDKIILYDRAIQDIVINDVISYPQMVWPGD
jgi:aminoglycoside phosphotransferase (APT) family kinase protein